MFSDRQDTPNQYILKGSDETALWTYSGIAGPHQHGVNKVIEGSDNNSLEIITKNTEEIEFCSASDPH